MSTNVPLTQCHDGYERVHLTPLLFSMSIRRLYSTLDFIMVMRLVKDLKFDYTLQNLIKTNNLHEIQSFTTLKPIEKNIKCSRLHLWHCIWIQFPNTEENKEAFKCKQCKSNNIIQRAKMEDRSLQTRYRTLGVVLNER